MTITLDRPTLASFLFDEPVDDVTRRELLTAGAGLLVLGLAGCGGDDPSGPADATRLVRHRRGSTRVPDRPERIAVLGPPIAAVLDLGLTPVAALPTNTTSSRGDFSADLAPRLDGVKIVGGLDMPNVETIAVARPDVIIAADYLAEDSYEELSRIAPTVAVGDVFDYLDTVLPEVAVALGVPDRATRAAATVKDRIEQLRQRLNVGSFSVVQLNSQQDVRPYGPGSWIVDTLVALGGRLVPDDLDFEDGVFRAELSAERLSVLAGRTLFVVENSGSGEVALQRRFRAKLERRSKLYQRLPAVRAGRVVMLEFARVSGFSGVSGYLKILDQLEDVFPEITR